jgi:hypothetical protein
MPIAYRHALNSTALGMAACIDARMKQLAALGLIEDQILPEMEEYLLDFHQLMMTATSTEIDVLCEEYAGFFRFAKMLETLASGIASGKIKIPGGKTFNKEHKIAAAIDLRVRQLEQRVLLVAHCWNKWSGISWICNGYDIRF